MGSYLNPGNALFKMAVNSQIFVDKSMLIDVTNRYLNTMQRFICVSRPRRFGKSVAADMLAAYYDRSVDSFALFEHLEIIWNTFESIRCCQTEYAGIFKRNEECR